MRLIIFHKDIHSKQITNILNKFTLWHNELQWITTTFTQCFQNINISKCFLPCLEFYKIFPCAPKVWVIRRSQYKHWERQKQETLFPIACN